MEQAKTLTTEEEAPITEENTLLDETYTLINRAKKKGVLTFRDRRQRLISFLFRSSLPKTALAFVIAAVLIVIGSANHQNNFVLCFCLGMTLLMYCIFTLDNDLLKQELTNSFKNKHSRTDEQNNIEIDEN